MAVAAVCRGGHQVLDLGDPGGGFEVEVRPGGHLAVLRPGAEELYVLGAAPVRRAPVDQLTDHLLVGRRERRAPTRRERCPDRLQVDLLDGAPGAVGGGGAGVQHHQVGAVPVSGASEGLGARLPGLLVQYGDQAVRPLAHHLVHQAGQGVGGPVGAVEDDLVVRPGAREAVVEHREPAREFDRALGPPTGEGGQEGGDPG